MAKVERHGRANGMAKTAVVERPVDRLDAETQAASHPTRFANLLAQLDLVPDLDAAFDPLDWDPHGLPK